MNKLDIKYNKKLVLKNVLKYVVNDTKVENIDSHIEKFTSFLRLSTIKTKGPLIIYTSDIKIDPNTGSIKTDFAVMIQLENEYNNHPEYKYVEKIKIPNCLFLRFEDREEYVQFATNKIDLEIYEEELTRREGLYQVLIQRRDGYIKTDFFQPIEEVKDAI